MCLMNVHQYESFWDDPDHDPDLTIIKPLKYAPFWKVDHRLNFAPIAPLFFVDPLIQAIKHKFRF